MKAYPVDSNRLWSQEERPEKRSNRTVNIDTGCVFGGRLTAMRYPEKDDKILLASVFGILALESEPVDPRLQCD